MVKGEQRGDSGRCGALPNGVLERCGRDQQDIVRVSVQPNIVRNDADGVGLTVDQRNTVERGEDDVGFVARIDDGGLGETIDASPLCTVHNEVVALFHEDRVEGAIVRFALVPLNQNSPTFIVGNIARFGPLNGVWSVVVIDISCWHDGAHDREVGEVLLACLVNTGQTNPNGYAGCE